MHSLPTFFSREPVLKIVAETEPGHQAIRLQDPETSGYIFALSGYDRYKRRYLQLGPFGQAAYPYCIAGSGCASGIAQSLKTFDTVSVRWNVRFDHQDLAAHLLEAGFTSEESTTHVLLLDKSYEDIVGNFSATTRNHIRKSERRGISVRQTSNAADFRNLYALYEKVVGQRVDWNYVYKKDLLFRLLDLDQDLMFLVAEVENSIIGYGCFFRDGDSMCYWHGAVDYEFKQFYPHSGIINRAINIACEDGLRSFNFGRSLGIESLERFKSSWGAVRVPDWRMSWHNPFWAGFARARRLFKSKNGAH